MESLLPLAERAGALLKARGETLAVAESSAGGLVSAALLAVPGASAYFRGGAVVYTRDARRALLGLPDAALSDLAAQVRMLIGHPPDCGAPAGQAARDGSSRSQGSAKRSRPRSAIAARSSSSVGR